MAYTSTPYGVTDASVYLMVQVMETWFLADRETLKLHFGRSFNERHINQWSELEEAPKEDILHGIKMATRKCSRPYTKGATSFAILGKIDPAQVEQSCPHAKAFLEYLRGL